MTSAKSNPRIKRSTTIRDMHRRQIARDEPPCHICGKPIDYALKYPHPQSFVLDHVVPLILGGRDVIENKRAAHNSCNRAKSDRVLGTDIRDGKGGRVYVGPEQRLQPITTDRHW